MSETGSVASKLYGEATTELRKRHSEEFVEILEGLYTAAGLVYRKRESQAEREARIEAEKLAKAQAQIKALVEKYGPGVIPTG